ncbi:MAG: hypothetical protein INR73_02645 [Williamsia sp.]|nr:hypothetical protein [Williamsia sp.]
MKRLVAVIFLLILLFNLLGYRLVAHMLAQRLDAQLEARLDDNQYDETTLIELKVALHMPYQTGEGEYERYDGEVKMNGITYKYVKRKLSGDTLYLKCIPHTSGMHLEAAKNDFTKNNSDLAQPPFAKKQGTKQPGWKKPSSEWEPHIQLAQAEHLVLPQRTQTIPVTEKIAGSPHHSPEQPPDLSAI